MKERDREIYVGEHRLYLAKDNILYFTGVGEYNEKTANAIKEASLKLANKVKGKVNVILNHNKARKPSSEARMIFKELTEHEKFGKIAHWGVHPVARVLASFVIEISNKKNMQFFKTQKEALEWINEPEMGTYINEHQ